MIDLAKINISKKVFFKEVSLLEKVENALTGYRLPVRRLCLAGCAAGNLP